MGSMLNIYWNKNRNLERKTTGNYGKNLQTNQEAKALFLLNSTTLSRKRVAPSRESRRLILGSAVSPMTQPCAGSVVGDTHFGLGSTSARYRRQQLPHAVSAGGCSFVFAKE